MAAEASVYLAVAEAFVRALHGQRAEHAANLVSLAVADSMNGERLTQLWAQLTARFGELVELRPLDVSPQDDRHDANLAARFARSELTIRVVLDRDARIVGFWISEPRPPAYEPPTYVDGSRFVERELTIGAGPTALGATASVPLGDGPFPAIVLVHGSGPNDRDETIGANRPFRDLAWGLASLGVLVLRYDKRTYTHPRQFEAGAWTAEREVVADALAALDVARAQPGVDPSRVFLLGHSLGATFAPLIAARDPRVGGIVMLAGASRPFTEVLVEQVEYLDALEGDPATAAQRDALVAQLQALGAGALPATETVLGAPAAYWYELSSHDVLAAARALARPALVLQGERDYQVSTLDLDRWQLAFADNARASFTLYPDLNHLFMTGTGRATPVEYTARTGHVAERVVRDVARFVGAIA